jgi:beta-lactamase regulating signal transducer with metallopeptidase domain
MISYIATLAEWSALQLAWQGWLLLGVWIAARALLRRSAPEARYNVAVLLLASLITAPVLTAIATHASLLSREATIAVQPRASADGINASGIALLFDNAASLMRWGILLWTVGASILLIRFAAGMYRLSQVRRRASFGVPLTTLTKRISVISARAGLARPPAIALSTASSHLMVFGATKPVLWITNSIVTQLSPDELDAVLLHEIAHVRRRDYAVNILQGIIEAMLWFHPATWILSAAIRAERELCCDAEALRNRADPFALARGLLSLQSTARDRSFAVAASGGALESRINAILSADSSERRRSRANEFSIIAGLVTVFLLFCASLAPAARSATMSESLLWTGMSGGALPGKYVRFDANDPAGRFQVNLIDGRVSSVKLAGARIPARRTVAHRDSVSVLTASGQTLLSFQLDTAGVIRWTPRSAQSSR